MSKTPSTFFGQLIARLGSETPAFFNKIVIFCGSLAGAGIAILGLNNMHIIGTNIIIVLPEFLVKMAGYMIAAGAVAGAVAKSSTTNPDLQAEGGAIPKAAVDAVKDANADEIKK